MDENKRLFENVYNETKDHVYKFIAAGCYKLSDIDDIFQNTYISIYNAICKGTPIEEPEAFAICVAKRELSRYYSVMRKLGSFIRSALPHSEIPDAEDADTYCIEDSVADRHLAAEVNKLLSKKDITTQKIFFLYYYRDMTLGEIAQLLGIGESAVKRRLYSTLEQLRRIYGKGKEGSL